MELVALAVLAVGVMVSACVLRAGYLVAASLERPEPAPCAPPAPTAPLAHPDVRRRPVIAPQKVR